MVYCECDRLFVSRHAQEQHKKDRTRVRQTRSFKCPIECCRAFFNPHLLKQHQRAKDHWSSQEEKDNAFADTTCQCGIVCHSAAQLAHHMSGRKHFKRMGNLWNKIKTPSKVQEYLEEFYENNVRVTKDDRTESVATVRDTLSTIMEYVRRQSGSEIYNPGLIKAGSHAVHTKIGKADEFDWGVRLNVTSQDMLSRTNGSVPYTINTQVRMDVVTDRIMF